jgi:hypothetical protein
MILLGVSANMIFVVFMPELVQVSMAKIGEENNQLLNDKISGIFSAFFSLGFFLAPLVSGFIN